jgi:hypothetical protein
MRPRAAALILQAVILQALILPALPALSLPAPVADPQAPAMTPRSRAHNRRPARSSALTLLLPSGRG